MQIQSHGHQLATCYNDTVASHVHFHSQSSHDNASIIAAPSLASAAEIHLSTSCLLSSSLASCSHAQRGSPAVEKMAT